MQTNNKFLFSIEVLAVLFLRLYCGDAARGHKLSVQFQRVDCFIYNKEIVQFFNCSLQRNDVNNELLLNTDLLLAQDVNDFKLHFKIVYDINGNNATFFDQEVDICSSFNNRFDFRVLRMIIDEVHNKSNIPLKCPLKKNVLYSIRNFTIDSKRYPQFFPEAKWATYYNFSIAKSISMGLSAFGTVKRIKL